MNLEVDFIQEESLSINQLRVEPILETCLQGPFSNIQAIKLSIYVAP